MLDIAPNADQMTTLIGKSLYEIWNKLCALIFEKDKENYSKEVQRIYDETKTYHDGKWMMFELSDTSMFDDFIRLLRIKRKPNRK